ncbi:histidine phosphatase family protein [Streptococcus pluranimalium]|uniref:histidine phosphatase family protein n=1 Tax=Streptococcus pluranimalium TaxID=82348 RepID=UPI00292FACC8|nr:histidine phosphatase family protein [Streptococcus pluranimalium]MDY3041059.1 histidine phosphatase family protein [Streptococcus pluranimalium]HEM6117238.1 histidine phosphatase family protein [Streptococcus suis]
MKQTIYLIRHAEPNYNNHQDDERELTAEGLQDCQLLLDYFKDITIDRIYSSPFKRALQTIDELAKEKNLPIQIKENFRERKIDDVWIDDFTTFSQRQWQDFNYKLAKGESLQEVQDRNIQQLQEILKGQETSIIISSHGTAISTILNYYDHQFAFDNFQAIKQLMPFLATLSFENGKLQDFSIRNLFNDQIVYTKRS